MKTVFALLLIAMVLGINSQAQDLIQHLDASISSSITLDASNNVVQWTDQSGNGNHATPETENITVNGDWLDFGSDLASMELFSAAESDAWLDQSTAGNGFCVLIVLKVDSLYENFSFLGNATTIGGTFRFLITSSGKIKVSLGGTKSVFNSTVQEHEHIVLALNYSRANSYYEVWFSKEDGSIAGNLAPADFSNENSFTIGSVEGAGSSLHGAVGEVKIYGEALTQEQFIEERAALTKKWADSSTATAKKINWRIVHEDPRFPSEDVIVASVFVTDTVFENPLPKDPANEDCSKTFQEAIDLAHADGGGTVFVPEGHYRLDNNIIIRQAVVLRGRWSKITADNPATGTIIKVYAGKNDPNGTPLITKDGGAIRDMTFWHPEQDPANIIKYPYVIEGGGTTENINFVNAYQGIYMPEASSCFVDNIVGTTLKRGLIALHAAAIARFDKIEINPDTWDWANLPDATPLDPAYKAYMLDSCIGTEMRETESFRLTNSEYRGLKYGVYFDSYEGATSEGFLANITTIGCEVGLMYADVNNSKILNSHIEGIDAALRGIGGIKALSSYFKGGNLAIESTQKGLEMAHCTFDGKILAPHVIKAVDCEFQNSGTDIEMAPTVPIGWVLGCSFADGPDIINNAPASADIVIDHDACKGFEHAPDLPLKDMSIRRKPSVNKMFNIMDFGATPNDGLDDTEAFAEAVDSVNTYGGIVFIPNGTFNVTGNYTLNTGTELRGPHGSRHRLKYNTDHLGAALWISGNENNPDGPAFITLSENCGVRGLQFFEPAQDELLITNNKEDVTPYPFVIRAIGNNVYVADVAPIGVYQAVHLQNSDNHLIENCYMGALHRNIYAENCMNGRIDNVQIKPYMDQYRKLVNKDNLDIVKNYCTDNLTSIEVDNCDDYIIHNIFNHGTHQYIKINNSSGIAHMVGGEQIQRGIHFSGGKDFNLVSFDVNNNNDGDETGLFALSTSSDFTGTINHNLGELKGVKALSLKGGTYSSVFAGVEMKSSVNMTSIDVAAGAILNLAMFHSPMFALNKENGASINIEAADFREGGVPVNFLDDDEITKKYARYSRTYAFACLATGNMEHIGMTMDMSNIDIVPYATITWYDTDERKVKGGLSTDGEYRFKVTDPVFSSGTIDPIDSEFHVNVVACSLEVYHNTPSGLRLCKSVTIDNSMEDPYNARRLNETVSFQMSGYQFGTDNDIVIKVVSGDTPHFNSIQLIRPESPDNAPEDLKADFKADTTSISIGQSVHFTDISSNNPTTWLWTFEGGTPATSTEQNPTVTYSEAGTFQVKLVVANTNGSDTITKVDYIIVLDPDTSSNIFIAKDSQLFVNVFPCPASDVIYVSMTDDSVSDFTFNLYNLNGTLILTEHVYYDGKNAFILDISKFTNGIYTYQLTSHLKTSNGKIIIQNE